MTCIVGYADGRSVWIAGDSAGVSGWELTSRADTKVFVRREPSANWVFGFTTSFRMGQVIRYHLALPEVPLSLEDPEEQDSFIVRRIVPAVRDALRAEGWLKKEHEREDGGTFLLGVAGRLYRISDDFQIGRSQAPFDAVGCGSTAALGALVALERYKGEDLHPIERLRSALVAAEALNIGVRGPFEVVVAEALRNTADSTG